MKAPLHETLLDQTLREAVQDKATVSAEGRSLGRLTHGVSVRFLKTHTDERGTVTELYDPRWGFHPEPLVFSYTFTIRPGVVKGWNLHRRHEDRYAILQGRMALVLFDPRPDSPTCGEVCRIVLSEHERCLVNVPINVWHADHNIGSSDVVIVNFPTIQYDHAAPDKWRLPLDTPLIPYRFPEGTTGG
ncbi:polysaccharide biosynthesis C-terminal domain-containing protein [Roseococcus pinisoli]|uniref:dTDP-4-dehydrorhamnose 3,5-epimerase n=1 Tax=Roseococcus pinisoli TaxID=2835040 RepID=A0ABS5QIF6_9PROT|nr:dTDP-4-dehydrorhamnose 3,5-epimerase family protein [Roseococcus pinisoli]MBS7813462.1 dTDP-4-dehydrorhamnose 3,5-epimerase family protein [Roseococcus pinisoli]